MYRWLVFLHVAATLGFMLTHGVSVSVAFALRRERNLQRIQALLELSTGSFGVMYLSLLILLVTGIISGFAGHWWGTAWIWLALILLIAIIVAMWFLGSRIYGEVRKAVGLPYQENRKQNPPLEPRSAQEIDALLSRGNPWLLTVVGFGGILVILWLMMFKPF